MIPGGCAIDLHAVCAMVAGQLCCLFSSFTILQFCINAVTLRVQCYSNVNINSIGCALTAYFCNVTSHCSPICHSSKMPWQGPSHDGCLQIGIHSNHMQALHSCMQCIDWWRCSGSAWQVAGSAVDCRLQLCSSTPAIMRCFSFSSPAPVTTCSTQTRSSQLTARPTALSTATCS